MRTDSVEMNRVVEGLPSIAAKIRALDGAGYARADVARFLGKRYQHVDNVLKQARRKAAGAPARSGASDRPRNVASQKLRVAEDGRIVIPAEMRSAMRIDESGHLTARVVEGELRVLTPKAAIFRLRRMVRDKAPAGVSLVDELIAERRAEARREDGR